VLVPEAQNTIATTEEVKSLLEIVDSIRNRFMERMVNGQSDEMFRETPAMTESDNARLKSYIDCQRRTF
jgi:hypothetical protein